MIQFELPKKSGSIIKVFGVGGGGGNAVNYMYKQGIEGVDFVIANTDAKALENSAVPNKINIGPALTQGLGAGANPTIGEQACQESINEIGEFLLDSTKMVFVTAGMGGGTGTGAAPIIAKAAKDLGILTVGIVTTPFSHEGRKRKLQAEEGINKLRQCVDTILVISNDKLRHQYGNLGFREAFAKADDVLATAAKCITDVINSRGHVVVDFADVCTVMKDGGSAILGAAEANGDDRAMVAVEKALNSPLLNDRDIVGAKWILLNITSSSGDYEHTLDEMDLIQNYIQSVAGESCDIILGTGYDETLGDKIGITIIATGFNQNEISSSFDVEQKQEEIKVVRELNINKPNTNINNASNNNISNEAVINNVANAVSNNSLPDELMPRLVVPEPPAVPVQLGMSMRPAPKPAAGIIEVKPVVQENPLAFELIQKAEPPIIPAPIASTPIVNLPLEAAAPAEKIIHALDMTNVPVVEKDEVAITATFDTTVKEEQITPTTSETRVEGNMEYKIIQGVEVTIRIGNHYFSEEEIQNRVAHELHNKRIEERSSNLKNISFNVKSGYNDDEIDKVPAYLRSDKSIDQEGPTTNEISTYSVDNKTGEIDRTNKWLFGKKKD